MGLRDPPAPQQLTHPPTPGSQAAAPRWARRSLVPGSGADTIAHSPPPQSFSHDMGGGSVSTASRRRCAGGGCARHSSGEWRGIGRGRRGRGLGRGHGHDAAWDRGMGVGSRVTEGGPRAAGGGSLEAGDVGRTAVGLADEVEQRRRRARPHQLHQRRHRRRLLEPVCQRRQLCQVVRRRRAGEAAPRVPPSARPRKHRRRRHAPRRSHVAARCRAHERRKVELGRARRRRAARLCLLGEVLQRV
mmetsp:Transcript_43545/g.137293  ORF Transcript_43545/g.137293 Transcript_43545/m.137293 type:complete len:245 (+) Transcript_43545:137-871(+)